MFAEIRVVRKSNGQPIRSAQEELEENLYRNFGKSRSTRVAVKRIIDSVYVRSEQYGSVAEGALSDIKDVDFLSPSIRGILKSKVPNYPNINLVHTKAEFGQNALFNIETNIDFNLANRLAGSSHDDTNPKITPASLLSPILSARAEMIHSGDRQCDIWTDPARSAVFRSRVESYSRRLEMGKAQISRFEEVAFSGRSFGESIKSGHKTIDEVLNFAESDGTRKFKQWLKNEPANSDLLSQYEKSKLAPSAITNNLPFRAVKLPTLSSAGAALEAALGGSGAIGLATGIGVDALINKAEAMLGPHLKIGWRPSQWVKDKALPYLPPYSSTGTS